MPYFDLGGTMSSTMEHVQSACRLSMLLRRTGIMIPKDLMELSSVCSFKKYLLDSDLKGHVDCTAR